MAENDPNAGGAQNATASDPATNTPPVVSAADIQAQINTALAKQQAEFAEQLKAATGHSDIKSLTEEQLKAQGKLQELADNKAAEAAGYKSKFEQTQISNALLSASTEAIDPATISTLLASKATVDNDGNVSIDGKPVADAVKQLLIDKPFLAKAQGGTGSGAPPVAPVTKPTDETLSPQQRLINARTTGN